MNEAHSSQSKLWCRTYKFSSQSKLWQITYKQKNNKQTSCPQHNFFGMFHILTINSKKFGTTSSECHTKKKMEKLKNLYIKLQYWKYRSWQNSLIETTKVRVACENWRRLWWRTSEKKNKKKTEAEKNVKSHLMTYLITLWDGTYKTMWCIHSPVQVKYVIHTTILQRDIYVTNKSFFFTSEFFSPPNFLSFIFTQENENTPH